MSWRKLDGTRILLPIVEAVEAVIKKEKELGNSLRICIGTDSQVRGHNDITFATVIVFLREGKGGYMYINSEHIHRPMTLKERMIYEVGLSVGVAYEVADLLVDNKIPLEVHADINSDAGFKSNIALKEAMGYIMGMGYEFKAKPHAFASSACADKVC